MRRVMTGEKGYVGAFRARPSDQSEITNTRWSRRSVANALTMAMGDASDSVSDELKYPTVSIIVSRDCIRTLI